MLTLPDLLKARFNQTGKDLQQVLIRLSDDDLNWSATPGMRTIRGLLLEIADKEREVVKWIQVGIWPDDDPSTFDENNAALDEIKGHLADLRKATFAYIDSLDDAGLNRLIQPPGIWWEALRMPKCPVHEILRNISAHEWYHTGQLVTYLWSRGDNPESW